MIGNKLNLYTFVDNHDVERIYTKLSNKAHFTPVHIMLYTLPGIPSLYYGSEFGIEGRKEKSSDDSLRPYLNYEDYKDAIETNPHTKLIAALGKIRHNTPALYQGEYKELVLQTTHFAYARILNGKSVIIAVNNSDGDIVMNLPAGNSAKYVGALTGEKVSVNGGQIRVNVAANSGEIWIPEEMATESFAPVIMAEIKKTEKPVVKKEEIKAEAVIKAEPVKVEEKKQEVKEPVKIEKTVTVPNKPYEEMTVEELQAAILEKMAKNGPVTDYMIGTVRLNTHHGSLVTWVKSFI